MPARAPSPRSWVGATVATFAAAVLACLVAACGPAPASLSDPRAILDAAVGHLRTARSVHLDAAVDGSLVVTGLIGGPPSSGPPSSGRGLGLTGTHLRGDLDLVAGRAAIRFQVPALLGLEGELRQLGADSYLESSLTSPGWHRLGGADLPVPLGRPTAWLDALTAWLERPATVPVRLDDAACQAGTCYVVRVVPSRGDLEALASAAPDLAASLGLMTVSVDLRVDRGSLVLSEAVIRVDFGSGGGVVITTTFTAWDSSITIDAPAASDLVSGPLFP